MAERESRDLEGMMRRTLRALVRRAAEGDTTALWALAALENAVSQAYTAALWRSHTSGGGLYSYGELAQTTLTTRQAVQQRIGRIRDTVPPDVLAWFSVRGDE